MTLTLRSRPIDIFLTHRPDGALELRNAPPSHAWLATCRRCCGPETLVAFFRNLETASSESLLALLRKFQGRGRITWGGKLIVIVDGPSAQTEEPAFVYLDRQPYGDSDEATVPHRTAKHFICEHGRFIDRAYDDSDDYYTDDVLESAWLPRATNLGARAFASYRALARVSMPVVECVSKEAFYCCEALQSVSLTARLIGVEAFLGCAQLHTVSLPFVERIPWGAFYLCERLTSVSMPVAAEVGAFYECESLVSVSLPSVRRLNSEAFAQSRKLEEISLPSLDDLESDAFCDCPSLAEAKILVPNATRSLLKTLERDSFHFDYTYSFFQLGGPALAQHQ